MLGIHHIVIENKRLRYEFDIRRNLTVIRGNSGTGKTTMISMLRSYEPDGEGSGITVICDSPCAVLNYTHWKASLSEIHDSIVFIDEDARFITSIDFARAIEHTSNYYVLITQTGLRICLTAQMKYTKSADLRNMPVSKRHTMSCTVFTTLPRCGNLNKLIR